MEGGERERFDRPRIWGETAMRGRERGGRGRERGGGREERKGVRMFARERVIYIYIYIHRKIKRER